MCVCACVRARVISAPFLEQTHPSKCCSACTQSFWTLILHVGDGRGKKRKTQERGINKTKQMKRTKKEREKDITCPHMCRPAPRSATHLLNDVFPDLQVVARPPPHTKEMNKTPSPRFSFPAPHSFPSLPHHAGVAMTMTWGLVTQETGNLPKSGCVCGAEAGPSEGPGTWLAKGAN